MYPNSPVTGAGGNVTTVSGSFYVADGVSGTTRTVEHEVYLMDTQRAETGSGTSNASGGTFHIHGQTNASNVLSNAVIPVVVKGQGLLDSVIPGHVAGPTKALVSGSGGAGCLIKLTLTANSFTTVVGAATGTNVVLTFGHLAEAKSGTAAANTNIILTGPSLRQGT
jgi:hypothetical protein